MEKEILIEGDTMVALKSLPIEKQIQNSNDENNGEEMLTVCFQIYGSFGITQLIFGYEV